MPRSNHRARVNTPTGMAKTSTICHERLGNERFQAIGRKSGSRPAPVLERAPTFARANGNAVRKMAMTQCRLIVIYGVAFTRVRRGRKLPRRPSSRGLLPTSLRLFSCPLKLPISLSMDLVLTAGEHVLRRDVANGTLQADIVVMFHVALRQLPRILQRQRDRASGRSCLARSKMISISASVINSPDPSSRCSGCSHPECCTGSRTSR